MVLGSFQCRGILLLWHMVGQGACCACSRCGTGGLLMGNWPARHDLSCWHKQKHYYQSFSHNSTRSWVLVGEKGLYFDRLPFNRWLKLFNWQIFSRLVFGIKGCSSKTRFISSIFRLLCSALWHYVREQIICTVYSDYVLVFAFAFLSCKKKNLL